MASEHRIQVEIVSIINRPHNAKFSEIEWVMKHLGAPAPKQTRHGYMFKLSGRRLMINQHSDGRSALPQYCVDDFKKLMMELGHYSE
jgi:hypothetical protein